jgi:hypothetical protein
MSVEQAQAETAQAGRNGQSQPGSATQVGPKTIHREGSVARGIEQQTAKMPSDYWLWAAFGSIGLSAVFKMTGQEKHANFVGLWAPTLLIFGIYNKLVKLKGSDGA